MLSVPPGVVARGEEPLARHLACRVGGRCEAFVVVHRREALAGALEACRAADLRVTLLGAGTRVAVHDGGVAGAVLRLGTGFSTITADGDMVRVGAAVPAPALVALAARAGLGGLATLARTPGSMGAAVHLDDAAWCRHVVSVTVLVRGHEREVDLDKARAKNAVVTGVTLRPPQDAASDKEIARFLASGDAEPPGSWYARPKRAKLRASLRRSGLGDVRLRGVLIPESAPELLVNTGRADARDLALLHKSALERVRRETGVELTARVRWLGRS